MNRSKKGRNTKKSKRPPKTYAGKKNRLASQLIPEALGLHKAGDLQQAEELYLKAIELCHDHPDANHLLGALWGQRGDDEKAILYMSRAVEAKPDFVDAHINLANAHRRQRQYEEAIRCLEKAVSISPNNLYVKCLLGKTYRENNQLKEAVRVFQAALEQDEKDLELWNELGNTLNSAGALDEAIGVYQQAQSISSEFLFVPYNLGNTYFAQGKLNEAGEAYEEAIRIDPQFAEARHNLGVVHREQKRFDDAHSEMRAAIRFKPDYFEAYISLGQLFFQNQMHDEAIENFEKALLIHPNDSKALFHLGNVLKAQEKYEPAVNVYQESIRQNDEFDDCYANLAAAVSKLGKFSEAMRLYKLAARINPNQMTHHYNLGHTHTLVDEYEAAIPHFLEALKLDENHVDSLNNLAVCLKETGQLAEAVTFFRRALALSPDDPELMMNLGNCFRAQGSVEEAISQFEHALELKPDYGVARSNYLFLLGYRDIGSPKKIAEAHAAWGDIHAVREQKIHPAPKSIKKKMRIGYVSPDFRNHAVARFFCPLIENHDSDRFEIVCYGEVVYPDEITERIRQQAFGWRRTIGLSDLDMAKQIAADEIDVLIDLAGHTARNRLGVFCHRPARVQASYLGYFTGTGLREMDYWITDAVLTPPDTIEETRETIYRLPRCWLAYEPIEESRAFQRVAREGDDIVFGSFNNYEKLNPNVIALWSEILRRLPKSRLLLKTRQLRDEVVRKSLISQFEQEGIPEDRLILMERSATYREHAESFNLMDIALDPFPMQGATTTAETLWMGVPVVSLRGERAIQRMSSSILSAVGCENWIAETPESYVEKVLELAQDKTQRDEESRTLRSRMEQSVFCDAADLARALENAYLEMHEKA
jgi:protein O-GlcNAc transferase